MSNTGIDNKPQKILLGQSKQIPDDVWLKICKAKRDILDKNPARSHVSHEEAIYKLIKNSCE